MADIDLVISIKKSRPSDLDLMAAYIAERLGIKFHLGVQTYWIASNPDTKMPGLFINTTGISVFRPPMIGFPLHHRDTYFSWEEMDEAIECYLKARERMSAVKT